MEKTIKCPYCGGETLIANAAARIICEYCDEEIILSNTADEQSSYEKTEGGLKGIDLFKLSPKKNCQECGSPTCMAFCMKVVQGDEEIDKCPYFSEEAKMMVGKTPARGVNLILTDAGSSKLETLKIIREYTGLGLKEAKDIVDSVPSTVKSNISHAEGTAIIKELAAIGAVAELCASGKEPAVPVTEIQTPAEKMFKFYPDTFDSEGMETWELLCLCLNAEYTFDKYIELVEQMAGNNSNNMAAPGLNNSLYKTIAERVSSHMSPGEKFLYYKDSGIFVTGKKGMLITSLKIHFIEKKRIRSVLLTDIKSIHHSSFGNYWYINNEDAVDSLNCTAKQLGIILAFILHMTKTRHSDEYRIGVYQR